MTSPTRGRGFLARFYKKRSVFMKKIINLLLISLIILCFTQNLFAQDRFLKAETRYSNDFTDWNIMLQMGSATLRTVFSKDMSSWDVFLPDSSGKISTVFSGDPSRWEYYSYGKTIKIETVFINDFTGWYIKGNNVELRASTVFSGDYSSWYVTGAGTMRVECVYSGDIGTWYIDDGMNQVSNDIKMGAIFACIISAVLDKCKGK